MSNPALATCILVCAAALSFATGAQTRGELLYSTHCIACHTTQVHWREQKLATDWRSLQAQVARWQAVGALGWSDQDISEVTGYLNERFYGFPPRSDAPVVLMPASDGRR